VVPDLDSIVALYVIVHWISLVFAVLVVLAQ
jgi:hypothetical protein